LIQPLEHHCSDRLLHAVPAPHSPTRCPVGPTSATCGPEDRDGFAPADPRVRPRSSSANRSWTCPADSRATVGSCTVGDRPPENTVTGKVNTIVIPVARAILLAVLGLMVIILVLRRLVLRMRRGNAHARVVVQVMGRVGRVLEGIQGGNFSRAYSRLLAVRATFDWSIQTICPHPWTEVPSSIGLMLHGRPICHDRPEARRVRLRRH
jgi:hypothetical protein